MVGKTVLHYKIIKKLGEGGMGVVYKAEDTKLKREVAIKFLPRYVSSNEEVRERFMVEAQSAASLNHPNIATVYSIDETDDQTFIVMELIDGIELKDKIRAGIISQDEATNIAIQIAEGLEAAHKKGIIHRDIKSSNIMINADSKIKIMDFGLAKIKGGSDLTRIGSTVGTVAYMSPEQAGGREVDQRTDIWSFGVVLYEMLTGELPFRGEYDQALIYSILNETHEPVSSKSKSSSIHIDNIIKKCLEKDLDDRYKSFAEVLKDFQLFKSDYHYQPNAYTARFTSFSLNKFTNKKKLAITAFVAAVIILLFISLSEWQEIKNLFGTNSVSAEQHLIILPFTNIGGNAEKQAFCDGLMETLSSKITQLEQFEGPLWVVPASEVVSNKIKTPNDAYKMYSVNYAVTGSLQFMNKMYRLTLNLIDARNVVQLSSTVIDIKEDDLFALQDESVIKLLEMLNIQLQPELRDILKAGGTTIPEAYAHYIQGRGYLLRYEKIENIEEAINSFKLSTASDPKYSLAYAGLGEAYWRKYESTKNTDLVKMATKECEYAFRLDSLLAPVNITLGMIYSGTGRYADAANQFNKALSKDPLNAAAYRGLAKAYESTGKNGEAEITFQKAIKLKPGYWAGYNDLGVFYYMNGKYEDAIIQFKKVIELTPDNYRGYNNLGGIYYMLERWKDAREMFERSLSIRKSYNIYSNLATLYYIEGKFEEAAKTYNLALELNDKDYLTWGNLAAAYHGIPGKNEKAIETYKHAIEIAERQLKINPNDPDVISNIASYYADVDNKKKSLSLLEKSLKIAPDNVNVFYRAATIYEHFGDRDKALHWIGVAIQNGYSRSDIENQPELKSLVADNRYKKLTENVKSKN